MLEQEQEQEQVLVVWVKLLLCSRVKIKCHLKRLLEVVSLELIKPNQLLVVSLVQVVDSLRPNNNPLNHRDSLVLEQVVVVYLGNQLSNNNLSHY